MTMQRVKQVQGLSFCYDIALRSRCSSPAVSTGAGCVLVAVCAQDVQTRGEARALASCPAISHRGGKPFFVLPVQAVAEQAGGATDSFVHPPTARGRGRKRMENIQRWQKWALRCRLSHSPATKRRRGWAAARRPRCPSAPGWRRGYRLRTAAGARLQGRRAREEGGGGGGSGGFGPVAMWKEKARVCRSCRLPALVPSGCRDTLLQAGRCSICFLSLF